MNVEAVWTILASVLVTAAVAGFARHAEAQAGEGAWAQRTPWGDLDLQGEWTSEGEFGVPLERPAEFGTREFLTDEEYAKRLADVQERDERDLQRVDVLAGKVEGPNAPIPHWREYETDSRRTSLVIDPPNGRLPPRTPEAAPLAVQRCGSLQRGEPCDSYADYGLGVRCIVHGGGFPDAMFPAVYNANFRIVQAPGVVAITYELIHDTRVIPIDSSPQAEHVSPAIRMYMGDARGHWEGGTLVVETANLKAGTRGASSDLRLVERFTRVSKDLIEYRVTFVDPRTWTTLMDRRPRLEGKTGRCRCVRVRLPRGQLRHKQHAVHGTLPRATGHATASLARDDLQRDAVVVAKADLRRPRHEHLGTGCSQDRPDRRAVERRDLDAELHETR